MPKTFQDAIAISRKLRIEYLWIDALCIIQDDEDDWRREIALMEYVYGGSYLNIAASSATSVHGGCWLKPTSMCSGLRSKVTVGESQLVREIRDDSGYERAFQQSLLATRAWALQEKLLPQRTIHLGDRGLYWECRTLIASEFLPDGFVDRLGTGLLQEMHETESIRYWWHNVVRMFTGADITVARDKLPALSGVARRVHSQRGGRYLAGLWRDERIEAQLCWRVSVPLPRLKTWRAPSWSWASVDGVVTYEPTQPGVYDDNYARVLDAWVTPLGNDPFGELSGGGLRIACAAMLCGRIVDQDTIVVQSVSSEDDLQLRLFLGSSDLDHRSGDADSNTYLLPFIGGKGGSYYMVNAGGDSSDAETDYDDESKWFRPKAVEGIVLRLTGDRPGEFYRVGSFECGAHGGMEREEALRKIPEYDLFNRLLKTRGEEVAKRVYGEILEGEDCGAETYVITVI